MSDDHSHDKTRHELDRRNFLKTTAALGALAAAGPTVGTSQAAALPEQPEVDHQQVAYQYFHTDWSDIEADIPNLADAGVEAIWVPQPAEAALRREDQTTADQEGYYGEEHPYYGTLEPHPPLGYQPVDLESFDSELGTEAELESMIETAHEYDVDVILDIVLNHMANPEGPEGRIEFPQFDLDEHFNDNGQLGEDCELDGKEAQYECDLLELPDLDVEQSYVQDVHADYVTKMAEVGADGIRMDAAKHIWPWYFEDEIHPLADDLGLWRVGEVFSYDKTELLEFADTGMTVFDFPLQQALIEAFEDGNLERLSEDNAPGVVHENPDVAVTFAQNHDVSGPGVGPDDPEGIEIDLAHAYLLSYEGMPMLFRADLDDPALRDLIWVKRNLARGEPIELAVDQEVYVFEREGNLLAGINAGSGDRTITVETTWSDEALVDVTGTGEDIEVDENGEVTITVPAEGWVMYTTNDQDLPDDPDDGEDDPDDGEEDPDDGEDGEDGEDGDDDEEDGDDEEDEETGNLDGTYRIEAVHSRKVLDVEGTETAGDGANVQQWEYAGGVDQQWELSEVDDGVYVVENAASGKVLEVADFDTSNGGNVQQWSYAGVDSQHWRIVEDGDAYAFVNVLSGKALDVAGVSGSDGANVHQWDDVGGDNQRWLLESV